MCSPLSFLSCTGHLAHLTIKKSLWDYFSSEQMQRIKEATLAILAKIGAFFNQVDNQPHPVNIKVIAIISCLALVTLLFFSILRRKRTSLIDPTAPAPR